MIWVVIFAAIIASPQASRPPPIEMTSDGTLIYDLDIRDRVMEALAEQGIEADLDGTGVALVRGPRNAELTINGQTWTGSAICVRVDPYTSNGDQLPAQSFLLVGESVILVRDPNPANQVWGAMWRPLSIDRASQSARSVATAECAKPAD